MFVLQPDVTTVHRGHTPSHMVSWTGPGFARVKDGAGLVFTIDNVPYAMEYDIMIRYEPEVSEAATSWEGTGLLTVTSCSNVCVCV